MRSEIKTRTVYLFIQLNESDANLPKVTLYNFMFNTYIIKDQ